MPFKRSIAGLWTAALLSSAAALAADSGSTLAALRLSPLPEASRLQAPDLQAPQLRPSIVERTASEGSAQIQLGAYRVKADADEDWNRLAGHADGLLGGLTPEIVSVDLPGRGRFYRLRVGPLDDDTADALCVRLKERGLACIPVKG